MQFRLGESLNLFGSEPGRNFAKVSPCGVTSITAKSVTMVLTHSSAVNG